MSKEVIVVINISPHFTDDKLENPTIDDLVDVLEDRITYWILEPAESLLNSDFGELPALCLMLTYFEAIRIYVTGQDSRNSSKQFFRDAFIDVFRRNEISDDLLGKVADILYDDARCGFFHEGMSRGRILFYKRQRAVFQITLPKKNGQIDETGTIQSILINAREFYSGISIHFRDFMNALRNPKEGELRDRFYQICRIKWGWQTDGPIIGMEDPTISDAGSRTPCE